MTTNIPTICAIATAPGRGGVGIVRVSGPLAFDIGQTCTSFDLKNRYAHFCDITDTNGATIDQGIAIFFRGPHSFTGEDVFEFQGHGGPIILDLILNRFLSLGAILAKPGEFSERAFLNDKLDLTQAEAIADLIEASSVQAAQNAVQSLKGEFAHHIDVIVNQLTQLRLYVESAIDFPEEEIDFLTDGIVSGKLQSVIEKTESVFDTAQQGAVLQEGMNVVLAGRPNAGKSTLLNALAERDVAIVTDIAGTTRDALTEHIHIDGMPLHVTDTAGIRDTQNEVEKIGIERAWEAIDSSDQILLLVDAADFQQDAVKLEWPEFFSKPSLTSKLTVIVNKIDLLSQTNALKNTLDAGAPIETLFLSAKSGDGLEPLKQHLLNTMGLTQANEGRFSARRRHLDALTRALSHLNDARIQLEMNAAGELMAEDLRLAQDQLGEITGKLHPDDLLGKIFSSFCIGK